MGFKQFLVSIGKSEKTASNYSGAIKGVMSSWASEQGLVKQSLLEISDLKKFEDIANKIRQLAIYEARNTVGKGMYNAALNTYADYVEALFGEGIQEDIAEILGNEQISETEKSTLVNTRIGQGQFRQKLVEHWQGCAITGYKNTRVLVASHIKPWRHSNNHERLDTNNGLLLLPNLDKAFDLGFISFENTGSIWISPQLEEPAKLGIEPGQKIAIQDLHRPYMAYHQEEIFRR